MSKKCAQLHKWFKQLERLRFPFDNEDIPLDGFYILFEKGERAHGTNRIVRVGTHTGEGQLRSRLQQHFINENKDRSIFRKNIGRCFLNKAKDDSLEQWNWSLTSRVNRKKYAHLVDFEKRKRVERKVSKYIQDSFSFVVIEVKSKKKRLGFESKTISTVSLCAECSPSKNWFGRFSPKEKIRESGLWLVNYLYKEPLSDWDMRELRRYL